MAFNEKQNSQLNKIRTTLLLLVNKELSLLKKSIKTKINSKEITEAEDYYASVNNYVVRLQEEQFVPNSITRDVIQNKNMKYNFSIKSPDQEIYNFIRKIRYLNKNNSIINKTSIHNNSINKRGNSKIKYDFKIPGKKSDISKKKNEFFNKKNLKLDKEHLFKNSKSSNFYHKIMFYFSRKFNFILILFLHLIK